MTLTMKYYILFGSFLLYLKMVRPDSMADPIDQLRNDLANQIRQQVQNNLHNAFQGIPMFQQSFNQMYYPTGPFVHQRIGSGAAGGPRCGRYTQIGNNNVIQNNAEIGDYTIVGDSNEIQQNAQIGKYNNIGRSNVIQHNCQFGDYVQMGDHNSIAYSTYFQNYANVGNDNKIGSQNNILSYVTIQSHATIGNSVKLCDYSMVFENAEIGDGSILDSYSKLKPGAKIRQNVYLGKYSLIEDHVEIPQSAVIHKYVSIPIGTLVEAKEVIIRSPSSLELYQQCASIQNIPPNYLTNDILAVLNQSIYDLSNELNECCGQGMFEKMAIIKSLYLIQFHGLESFKQYEQQVKSSRTQIFGPNCSEDGMVLQELENQVHFGPNAVSNKLSPDVEQKLIKLLLIEEDGRRRERVVNDDFCTMSKEILSGERKGTCAKRDPNVFCSRNYQNIV